MSAETPTEPLVVGRDLHKTFSRGRAGKVRALDGVSLELQPGTLTALVGPDGAGKTTLIRLITGLLHPDSGSLQVLGVDLPRHAANVQARIGYMPQRFGLYEDLTVQENLDLYADLHGIAADERAERYERLLDMTALGPFTKRLAGRLSGGMKQKLGLACTLVRSPELLVLDEPTVGVDPLSRRELWEIIDDLVRHEGLTVLLSTAYMDEAEKCGHVVVLREGQVLAEGEPGSIAGLADKRTFLASPAANQKARDLQAALMDVPHVVDAVPEGGKVRVVGNEALPQDAATALPEVGFEPVPPRLEDGFMVTLAHEREAGNEDGLRLERKIEQGDEVVIQVDDLVRTFGDFTAVNHVSFAVRRGEVFGLLGPNGAGKTTTFRMLCGLLPATSGHLEVAGLNLRVARDSARKRLGYVAQKFSLYGQLSVVENLQFFASAYGLRGRHKRARVAWAMEQFDLAPLSRLPSGQLPGGYKQRLAMAAALLHEPEILFLDEPTSGADPLARREFWSQIGALVRQGVTAVVTTHFMEEAEYCDHIVIQDAGKVLASGTPAEVRARAHQSATMEEAFIAVVEEGRRQGGTAA
jgi:ABC-2 type transport system ATP-binding protein